MMTSFHVGQKFSSFSEFEQYLSCYENENFVKFCKRNSRKVETAMRAGKTNVKLKPDLIYYEIRYNCVRGGAVRPQGTGKRKTSTCKTECSAQISLRAAADGNSLEVKSFDNTHNHEISKVLFDHLPQQRRLSESDKNKARELLSLKANKKLIQQKLQKETGKIVTLRDLSNIAAKSAKSSSNDELHESVSLHQETYHADVDPKSIEEKRKMALNITNEIADIVSLLNMDDFNKCMHMLKDIKSHLQNGTKFQVQINHEIQNTSSGISNASQNMPSTSGSFTSQSILSESPSSKLNDSELDLSNCSTQQAIALKSIQMPQIRKRKICPKVHLLTVIGLPKKKACHSYPNSLL